MLKQTHRFAREIQQHASIILRVIVSIGEVVEIYIFDFFYCFFKLKNHKI